MEVVIRPGLPEGNRSLLNSSAFSCFFNGFPYHSVSGFSPFLGSRLPVLTVQRYGGRLRDRQHPSPPRAASCRRRRWGEGLGISETEEVWSQEVVQRWSQGVQLFLSHGSGLLVGLFLLGVTNCSGRRAGRCEPAGACSRCVQYYIHASTGSATGPRSTARPRRSAAG